MKYCYDIVNLKENQSHFNAVLLMDIHQKSIAEDYLAFIRRLEDILGLKSIK